MSFFRNLSKVCDTFSADLCVLSSPVQLRCRHAQFAAYFGDDPPSCVNRCDVCTNSAKVSQLLAGYRRVIYGSSLCISVEKNTL